MNMAIAFSRTGRQEEAIRSYRRALEIAPEIPGAHYGLAFLLIKRNERNEAMVHLESLSRPSARSRPTARSGSSDAQDTLRSLREAEQTTTDAES